MLGAAVGLILAGLALLVLADAHRSFGMLLGGTVVAGAAMALGYRSSVQIVDELIAPDDQHAEDARELSARPATPATRFRSCPWVFCRRRPVRRLRI